MDAQPDTDQLLLAYLHGVEDGAPLVFEAKEWECAWLGRGLHVPVAEDGDKSPKKNDLPSPPCFPISATTGRLSWRPWMRHRKTNEHNSAAGTLLSDRSPSAKWRHAPPHTQAREAKARNVSARDIPTTCKVSSTVSQRHTSSIKADRRWRSRKANLNKAGVACAFKCWMRRSATHGLSGVFLKCRAR